MLKVGPHDYYYNDQEGKLYKRQSWDGLPKSPYNIFKEVPIEEEPIEICPQCAGEDYMGDLLERRFGIPPQTRLDNGCKHCKGEGIVILNGLERAKKRLVQDS